MLGSVLHHVTCIHSHESLCCIGLHVGGADEKHSSRDGPPT